MAEATGYRWLRDNDRWPVLRSASGRDADRRWHWHNADAAEWLAEFCDSLPPKMDEVTSPRGYAARSEALLAAARLAGMCLLSGGGL